MLPGGCPVSQGDQQRPQPLCCTPAPQLRQPQTCLRRNPPGPSQQALGPPLRSPSCGLVTQDDTMPWGPMPTPPVPLKGGKRLQPRWHQDSEPARSAGPGRTLRTAGHVEQEDDSCVLELSPAGRAHAQAGFRRDILTPAGHAIWNDPARGSREGPAVHGSA